MMCLEPSFKADEDKTFEKQSLKTFENGTHDHSIEDVLGIILR